MKKIILFLLVILLTSLTYAIPTYHQFYGSVMNESNDFVDGSVSAKINGIVFETSQSSDGKYGYSPVFIIENGVNGNVISFYVNSYFSVNYTFQNEETTELNLTLNLSSAFECIDSDLDGYNSSGIFCGIIDCNDSNVNIHPNAAEVCNNIDDNCVSGIDEGCGVSPPGGNSGNGGGSGGGATAAKVCAENWTCGDWNDCVNGEQSRICADMNNCNTTLKKPETMRVCEEPITTREPAGKSEIGGFVKSVLFNWKYALIAVGSLISVILVIIFVVIIVKRKSSNKSDDLVKARGFVSAARKKGYSDEKIRKMFLDKGWKEKDIKKIL